MTATDSVVAAALRAAGDPTPLRERAPVGGGCISQTLRLRTGRGEYLLKWGGPGLPGFYAAEARGLALLRATGAVRVPEVLACHDSPPADPGPASFILLEWLAEPPGAGREAAGAALGARLAALHRASAPAYGLDHDNYLGATPQPNGWMASWAAFFRERRLAPQAELAGRNGHLGGGRARRLARLLDRLGDWLDDRLAQPALLHGDLWSGNVLPGPALIDPAAYYGDREAELAYTALFGGFPESFYRAYAESWPLPAGWRDRRDLYNLYHLLNHLNLFGESYGGAVDATLRRYVG